MIGVMVVTSTPPAPGIPFCIPLKKSILYKAMSTEANINEGKPLVLTDNFIFMKERIKSKETKVNTKRRKAISIGCP
jgi:hypothetical protein